jgi:hypothetical protein
MLAVHEYDNNEPDLILTVGGSIEKKIDILLKFIAEDSLSINLKLCFTILHELTS